LQFLARSSSISISIHLGINFAPMASDKQDCNQLVRFFSAVFGGIVAFVLGRIAEKCYDHFRRRYRSANTTTSNARTSAGDDSRALDNPDNTLYPPVYNTPVTSPGHAISDMDRDIKNGWHIRRIYTTQSDKTMEWFCSIFQAFKREALNRMRSREQR
jgi:hypothetical protein